MVVRTTVRTFDEVTTCLDSSARHQNRFLPIRLSRSLQTALLQFENTRLRHPPRSVHDCVGGLTCGDTPVPIPNTAVKSARPMVVLRGESRLLPALNTKRARSERI